MEVPDERAENLKKVLLDLSEKMAATRECLLATEVKIKTKKNKLASAELTHVPNPDNPMMTFFDYPPPSLQNELNKIACALVVEGKGLFAVYESTRMLESRLYEFDIEDINESKCKYEHLLFTVDPRISQYISGMVLNEDTLHRKFDSGLSVIDLLQQRSIIPGINVDKGVITLYGTKQECTTEGLNDLGTRCVKYKNAGLHFAKWRSVFKITSHTPSYQAINENCIVMGRYASICQANRLVPIIQIDVIQDGNFTSEQCQKVQEVILAAVYKALHDYHVFLEGSLLKCNMIMQGLGNVIKCTPDVIAECTMTALMRTVPCAVPGILFSGGEQSAINNTIYLNTINRYQAENPWRLTFAYGRNIMDAVMHTWAGQDENIAAAQHRFIQLAKDNSDATNGQFVLNIEPGHIAEPDLEEMNELDYPI